MLTGNRKLYLGALIVVGATVLCAMGLLSAELWLGAVGGVYGGFVAGNTLEHRATAKKAPPAEPTA